MNIGDLLKEVKCTDRLVSKGGHVIVIGDNNKIRRFRMGEDGELWDAGEINR